MNIIHCYGVKVLFSMTHQVILRCHERKCTKNRTNLVPEGPHHFVLLYVLRLLKCFLCLDTMLLSPQTYIPYRSVKCRVRVCAVGGWEVWWWCEVQRSEDVCCVWVGGKCGGCVRCRGARGRRVSRCEVYRVMLCCAVPKVCT